jgi:hypothetical protein
VRVGEEESGRLPTHLHQALLLVAALLRLEVRVQQVDERLHRAAGRSKQGGSAEHV